MKSGLRILLWAPEFTSRPGGVQQYTRDVLWAVARIAGPENIFGLAYGAAESSVVDQSMKGYLSVGDRPRALRGLAFAAAARRICARFSPNVIFSVFPRFAPVGVHCARRFGIPFFTAAHGVEIWGRQGVILRRALASSDRVLPVSEYTARRIIAENGVNRERVSVLPNCVDPERFHPGPRPESLAERFRIDARARVILTVARLDASEHRKGVSTLIRAMPEILRQFPHTVLLIVGDGADRRRLEEGSRDLGAAVKFAGRVSPDELPDFYRLCDCFAMPSEKEGFGIVFLEALATGKPVIAGNADGSNDPLCGGTLGWLVDPREPREVARAVRDALDDPQTDPRRDPHFLRENVVAHFGREIFLERMRTQILGALRT